MIDKKSHTENELDNSNNDNEDIIRMDSKFRISST